MPGERPGRPGEDGRGASVTPLSTGHGGKTPRSGDRNADIPDPDLNVFYGEQPSVTEGENSTSQDDDPTHAALDRVRDTVAGTPRLRRRDRDRARRTRRENLAGRGRGRTAGGYSGPGPDPERDPQRLGTVLGGYVTERGWERPLAQARVFADWAALVGADVAAHCAPQSLHEGELRVVAESTAWATQLRLLGGSLLARLVAELGPDVVTKLHVSGPTGPTWKHGNRTVRGRGPRDTYG